MDYTIFTSNVLENTVIEEEKEVISYWHDPYENVLVIVFPLLSLERQWELSVQYGLKKSYSHMLKQQLPYFFQRGYLEVYKAVPSFGWAVAEKLPYEWEEEMVVKESHPSGFHPGVEILTVDAEVIPYLPLGITSAVEVELLGKEILDEALSIYNTTSPKRVCPKQLSKSKLKIKEFGYSDLEIKFLSDEMILQIAEFVESLDK